MKDCLLPQPDVLFQRIPTNYKIQPTEWHLFRDQERLWLRASDYKNHRIFTLRCLHKELIPVSIKLKSTLKTEKANKIIRKAEKDLLQARVKAINSILDNVTKQTELCRSQLASILSVQRLRDCQGFVDKVGEIRFTKVKQRQLNKFNNLLNKKEGNITNSPLNLAYQTGRQAGRHSPFPWGRKQFISGRQSGRHSPSPGEGGSLSQAGSQASQSQAVTSQLGRQAGTHLPSGKGSNLVAQAIQSGRQALTFPPGKEVVYLRQIVRSPSPRQLLPS